VTRVHQVLSSAGPFDAVGGQALRWQRLLEPLGLAGGLYSDIIDPRSKGMFKPIGTLDPAADDLLVIRYSAYRPALEALLELPQRKLLVYHNVTPPRYYWRHHPGVAVACAVGRDRLPRFAHAARVSTADSAFNARDLERVGAHDVRVVPILLDAAGLGARGRPPISEGPLVLVVGRYAPNKRHDLVLAAFAAYQRECSPEARLLCVGEPLTPAYLELVRELARATGARNVELASGLSQPDLNAAYAEADVLLSMSEHEGFCVPLLEAFHFGVPVVARPLGAVPEVAGDAALWIDDPEAAMEPPDLAVAAELIHLAVTDSELRDELRRRGRARLEHFSPERTAEAIRAAIDAAIS
jgi:glycosyltransferase involved in cell wall biosynthesis